MDQVLRTPDRRPPGPALEKTPLPEGGTDTGLTVISQDDADAVAARLGDPSRKATGFRALTGRVLADPLAASRPYDRHRGRGTSFQP